MSPAETRQRRRKRVFAALGAASLVLLVAIVVFQRSAGTEAIGASTPSDSPARGTPGAPATEQATKHDQAVQEGSERSRRLIEDALAQAKQRTDVDPSYVAELERLRAELDSRAATSAAPP
jgi:hypothetical protein